LVINEYQILLSHNSAIDYPKPSARLYFGIWPINPLAILNLVEIIRN